MVTIGPTAVPQNFTHMFDLVDLRSHNQCDKYLYSIDGLLHYIHNCSLFLKFSHILKISKMEEILNDLSSSYTIFIPIDNFIDDEIFSEMDVSLARHIVKSSLLDNKIHSALIKSDNVSYFNTKNNYNKLLISNIDDNIFINNALLIQKDIVTKNGIIHITDQLINPIIRG